MAFAGAAALAGCNDVTGSTPAAGSGGGAFAQAAPAAAPPGMVAPKSDRRATLAQSDGLSAPMYAPSDATPAPRPSAPREWTGESGSSGHPSMQASAIRSAAANFPACLEGLWPAAAKRGVSRASFDRHTAGLTPDLRLMDLMDAQPEFSKAFWEYLDLLVSETRIQNGIAMLAKHKAVFDQVEQRTGVDRYAIAGIWGVETAFGTITGDRPVIRSTATLACVGRRQAYFRDEFLAALEILHHGDIKPERFKGSWAGAFGQTQFMPTTFKRAAVDGDGDGRRDVVDSIPDIVASTADKLKKAGWRSGETWGYEVALPKGFDYLLADRSKRLTLGEWQRLGVTRPNGAGFPRAGDRGYLLVPAGKDGPAFVMLENFSVLMKYNPAEAYALAIGHLGDRFRGGAPLVGAWPRSEPVLSLVERREMQELLRRKGFDGGDPTGRLGSKSRSAIRDYQASIGAVPDGFASATVLARLRR